LCGRLIEKLDRELAIDQRRVSRGHLERRDVRYAWLRTSPCAFSRSGVGGGAMPGDLAPSCAHTQTVSVVRMKG